MRGFGHRLLNQAETGKELDLSLVLVNPEGFNKRIVIPSVMMVYPQQLRIDPMASPTTRRDGAFAVRPSTHTPSTLALLLETMARFGRSVGRSVGAKIRSGQSASSAAKELIR